MTNWYYSAEGHATGPVSEQKLGDLARDGIVSTDTLIWHPAMQDWEPVWKLKPEIIEHLNKSAMARQAKGTTDRIPAAEVRITPPAPPEPAKGTPAKPDAEAEAGILKRWFARLTKK